MDNINEMLLWNNVINDDVEEALEEVAIQRDVLPQSDAFRLSEHKFVQLFRVSKNLCHEIVNVITPFMQPPFRASSLSIETKVLAALRFYASGSHQEITGSNHFVGISQASTSRAITEVTNALNQQEVLNNFIRFPRNAIERESLRTSFYQKYRFPGIIGCIDCTHVAIIPPPADPNHPEHIYVNRKNYHSLNVQLICDSNLKILNVNARFPGSTHDSYIWRQSPVSTLMEQIYRRDPGNIFFLIGDSGYPTRPWLLTPLPNTRNPGEENFNQRFKSTRSIIERCNGVLKNRFRCLLRYRTLHYHPTTAGRIVNACCILHNMCLDNNIPEPNDPHLEEPDYGIYVNNIGEMNRFAGNQDLFVAREIQQNIILNHFNN